MMEETRSSITGTIIDVLPAKFGVKIVLKERERPFYASQDFEGKVGEKRTFEFESREKYDVIKYVHPIEGYEEQTNTEPKSQVNNGFRTSDQIMKSTALECAVESIHTSDPEIQKELQLANETIMSLAKQYYQWIKNGD